ncbi:uncharacterized protein LOC109615194 [Esox lucius]|uniref:uncharacterized protein LOC109615194 n=1 Tax=Esox lucius TaxID=8010 RepID=UPI0014775ED4|nr:uncharacterized protein LOC109615194 [Esox lucius]
MCRGVMERSRLANQPVPKIMYVDRGCGRVQGPTALGIWFQPWVDNGMVVRLDIFPWIHRLNAATRTESHSKYATFKSALAGAVLAYNRTDLKLLIKAVRAKDPAKLSDEDVVRHYISREHLKHHVWGGHTQETFRIIHLAIEELKGHAGLDERSELFQNTWSPLCSMAYQVYQKKSFYSAKMMSPSKGLDYNVFDIYKCCSRHTATHYGRRVNSGGFVAGECDVGQDGIQRTVVCLHIALVRLVCVIWIRLPRSDHLLFWTRSIVDNVLKREGPRSPRAPTLTLMHNHPIVHPRLEPNPHCCWALHTATHGPHT